jgi:hypothetical protein
MPATFGGGGVGATWRIGAGSSSTRSASAWRFLACARLRFEAALLLAPDAFLRVVVGGHRALQNRFRGEQRRLRLVLLGADPAVQLVRALLVRAERVLDLACEGLYAAKHFARIGEVLIARDRERAGLRRPVSGPEFQFRCNRLCSGHHAASLILT